MDFPLMSKFDRLAFDTEATGLRPYGGDRVFGFSISTPDNKDYYYDVREQPEMVEMFNHQMADYRGEVICHNLSFDYRMSHASGMNFSIEQSVDTVIQGGLINEHEHSYSLDNLSRKYTGSPKSGAELYKQLAALFGGRATRNVQMKNIALAPPDVVSPYAKDDTRATLDLNDYQKTEIQRQGLGQIVEFEKRVTPVLLKAEMAGVRVDTHAAEQAVGELSVIIKRMQKELNVEAGFPCNPQPSGDIKKLFRPKWRNGRWWAIDGTPLKETDAGNASLGADALRLMKHPAAGTILELRKMLKTRDTFLVGHVLESAHNGRVYPSINQTKGEEGGTGTGRLSYTDPALQQIPDRDKSVAKIIKRAFLPDEGHFWVDADMASFEVRIFAHLVGTQDIIQTYIDDPERDFHQYVADLTGLVRNATYNGQPNAKQLNLSMIFNQGDGTTADEMGLPWEWASFIPKDPRDGANPYSEVVYKKPGPEAMDIINRYHAELPGVKVLAKGCKKRAEERGYIFTRYGRHLRFPRGYKSYSASGILIQATAADENKKNWLLIDEAIQGTGARIIMNTHDSYSLSIPIGEEKRVSKLVKERVEEDRGLKVPLILEVNHPGNNWWESKSSKRWL